MTKVRTLSRTFMKGHPRAGEPTFFVEKFLLSRMSMGITIKELKKYDSLVSPEAKAKLPKHHTIRMGRHFKANDELTLAVWSGKPYRSKQVKLWTGPIRSVNILIIVRHTYVKISKDVTDGLVDTITPLNIYKVANNDGLEYHDFLEWFKLPVGVYEAQILIWNPEINY